MVVVEWHVVGVVVIEVDQAPAGLRVRISRLQRPSGLDQCRNPPRCWSTRPPLHGHTEILEYTTFRPLPRIFVRVGRSTYDKGVGLQVLTSGLFDAYCSSGLLFDLSSKSNSAVRFILPFRFAGRSVHLFSRFNPSRRANHLVGGVKLVRESTSL